MASIGFVQASTQQVVLFHSHMHHTFAHKHTDHTLSSGISTSTGIQKPQTTLPSLLMNHYEHHEPGHQSGWCCHVWKLATELKVTFIIRQTAMRHSIRTAVLSLYFMTLSILRVLFNGSSSEDTEVERATEWIVTVKGQCKIYSCSFWP